MNKQHWNISQKDSSIYFKVKYLQISTIKGIFQKFRGNVFTDQYFSEPEVHLALDSASLETYNSTQNQTLRSNACLASSKYPSIDFHAINGCKLSSGKIWELTGNLSVRNISYPITMVVTLSHINNKDRIPNARFNLFGKINLHDFGFSNLAGKEISNEIQLFAEITLVKSSKPHSS